MKLMWAHYWVTFDNAPYIQHIREIGDIRHTYCNAKVDSNKWRSDNIRMDIPIEQVCPVCYSLYTLELF